MTSVETPVGRIDPTDPALLETIRTMIRQLGEDPEREGLRDTPRRIAAM